MAEETPFGLSFGNYGDPRKYIGKGESPAKKIQEKIAKIQKSPLANLAGILMAGGGEDDSKAVIGPGIAPPAASKIGVNPNAPSAIIASPETIQSQPTVAPAQNVDLDGDGQIDNFWGVKSISPQSSIDVKNTSDFNPLPPDTSNQLAVSGNDYQQVPGYGKLQKIASAFFGQG